MKNLNVIYVITGNEDKYIKQLVISIKSLCYHNPECKPIILTDKDTAFKIDERYEKSLKKLSILKIINIPIEFKSSIERSRYIKTNIRNLIDGDFIFLDTDTVVCASLLPFSNLDCELGLVYDFHLSKMKFHPDFKGVSQRFNDMGLLYDKQKPYFNSGVIYCKDTIKTRLFFDEWHKTWKNTVKKGIFFDQISLNAVNYKENLIKHLPGRFHCQIEGNGLKYFNDALIIHYYNIFGSENKKFPLHNSYIFNGTINDILNNKTPSLITNPNKEIFIHNHQIELISTDSFIVLNKLFQNKKFFSPFNKFNHFLRKY